MASDWQWHSNCWPILPMTRYWTGRQRFEDMPRMMPRILAPGGLCHVITYGNE